MKNSLFMILLMGTLAGCNTIEGVGADISASARAVGDRL
jgi:predicted small secreted protein